MSILSTVCVGWFFGVVLGTIAGRVHFGRWVWSREYWPRRVDLEKARAEERARLASVRHEIEHRLALVRKSCGYTTAPGRWCDKPAGHLAEHNASGGRVPPIPLPDPDLVP